MKKSKKKIIKKISMFGLIALTGVSLVISGFMASIFPSETVKAEENIEYPVLDDNWYKDWDWGTNVDYLEEKDDNEPRYIYPQRYKGNETNYRVPAKAIINGKVYTTLITGNTHFLTGSIKRLAFEKGTMISDCRYLFEDNDIIEEIDFSNLDTSNVEEMEEMCNGCDNLKKINLSNFNTQNATRMEGMFYQCKSLTSLDLSSFDTSKVENMRSMFGGSYNLKSIYLGKNFKFVENSDGDAGLPDYFGDTDEYSGKWTFNDENNHKAALTAKELMETYDGSTMAGKWVAERKGSSNPEPSPTISAKPINDDVSYSGNMGWPIKNTGEAFTDDKGKPYKNGKVYSWDDITSAGDYGVSYNYNEINVAGVPFYIGPMYFIRSLGQNFIGNCYGMSLLASLENDYGISYIKRITGKPGYKLSEYGYSGIRKDKNGQAYYYVDSQLSNVIDTAHMSQFTMQGVESDITALNNSDNYVKDIGNELKKHSVLLVLGDHAVAIQKNTVVKDKTFNNKVYKSFELYDPNSPQLSDSLKNDNLKEYYSIGPSYLLIDDNNNAYYLYSWSKNKNGEYLPKIQKSNLRFKDPSYYLDVLQKNGKLSMSDENNEQIFVFAKNLAISADGKQIFSKDDDKIRNISDEIKWNEYSGDVDYTPQGWLTLPKSQKNISIGDEGGTIIRFSSNDKQDSIVKVDGGANYTVDDNQIHLTSDKNNLNVTIETTVDSGESYQSTSGKLNKNESITLFEDPNSHMVYGKTNSTAGGFIGKVYDENGNADQNVIFDGTTSKSTVQPTPTVALTPSASVNSGSGKPGTTTSNGSGNNKKNNKTNSNQQDKKPNKNEVPNTGDRNNVGIYAGLFAVAVIAGIAIIFIRRKPA